jgi:hypothetical protein
MVVSSCQFGKFACPWMRRILPAEQARPWNLGGCMRNLHARFSNPAHGRRHDDRHGRFAQSPPMLTPLPTRGHRAQVTVQRRVACDAVEKVSSKFKFAPFSSRTTESLTVLHPKAKKGGEPATVAVSPVGTSHMARPVWAWAAQGTPPATGCWAAVAPGLKSDSIRVRCGSSQDCWDCSLVGRVELDCDRHDSVQWARAPMVALRRH